MKYLRTMSPETGAIPLRAHTIETVAWSTADAFLRRVRTLRAGVEQRVRDLVDRAGQFGTVLREPVVQPAIELRVVDQRKDKTVPLPTIDR